MKLAISLFCLVLVAGSPLFGQPPGGDQNDKPMERLERLRNLRMVEMLDLKEDQSVRFFARLKEHDQTRHELRKERNEVLDKIERLVRNHAPDQEYEQPFAEIAAIDQKMAQEGQSFISGLKDILTVEQRAKLMLFERRFEGELREAIRAARMRRNNQ
jgi:hypothetical protein